MYRVGQGFDIHQLLEKNAYLAEYNIQRDFILGGVVIDSEFVAVGHSDADCLTHAVIDALLGALSLGDIGQHFPDNNPEYKGTSSIILLKHVYNLVFNQGYMIVNLDSTIILEKPKLSPYIIKIRTELANTLNIPLNDVSVKAKTHEKLDSIGSSQAVAAQAIVMLKKL